MKNIIRGGVFSLCVLGAAAVSGEGIASYVYVATDGNDTTGDGSFENPYLTPSNGLAKAYADATKDTVYLKAGTYKIGKALTLDQAVTLKGESRDTTIVQQTVSEKAETGRVVNLSSADARVESLTLKNGKAPLGGNVYMSAGVVSNCVITGGYCYYGRSGSKGGNVYMTGGTITHSTVRDSKECNYGPCGGGIAVMGADVTIDTCLILNNLGYQGWAYDKDKRGGGIYLGNYMGIVVQNCTVAKNKAGYGGGIYSENASAIVRNCIFADNTVVDQASSTTGYPNMDAADAVAWVPCISNIIVSSGTAIAEISRVGDPLFVSASDFHLSSEDSPAVEYGQAYEGQCGDLEGKARKAKPDCGCYESDYHSQVIEQGFVSVDFTPASGLSGTAVSFAAVLDDPPAEETFVVTWKMYDTHGGEIPLSGTALSFDENITTCGYFTVECSVKGTKNPKRTGTKQATSKLHIVPQVQYVNSQSATPSYPYDAPERAAKTFAAVADELLDGVTLHIAAGTYGVAKTIVIGDVRICGEDVTNTILTRSGTFSSLVSMNDARACVSNLTLSGGTGTGGGAKINSAGGTLTHCRVTGASFGSDDGNYAYGAAIWTDSAYALVDNCQIDAGEVKGVWSWGTACGVVYLENGKMRNSVVYGCTAVRNGKVGNEGLSRGIVYVGANGLVENCTIADNVDNSSDAWAICVMNGGQVINTIVANNQTPQMTTKSALYGLPNWKIGSVAAENGVNNCCFGVDTPLGTAARSGDPRFVDSANGDYRLMVNSPCCNKGQARTWAAGAKDFYGQVRVYGSSIDIGAAECQKAPGLVILMR